MKLFARLFITLFAFCSLFLIPSSASAQCYDVCDEYGCYEECDGGGDGGDYGGDGGDYGSDGGGDDCGGCDEGYFCDGQNCVYDGGEQGGGCEYTCCEDSDCESSQSPQCYNAGGSESYCGCESDTCDAGEYCSEDGSCEVAECFEDSDCAIGNCRSHECVACSSNSCSSEEFCNSEDQKCTQICHVSGQGFLLTGFQSGEIVNFNGAHPIYKDGNNYIPLDGDFYDEHGCVGEPLDSSGVNFVSGERYSYMSDGRCLYLGESQLGWFLSCEADSLSFSTCGDGNRSVGEACDDGAQVAGDGCSEYCQVEEGFVCDDLAPDVCEQCFEDSDCAGENYECNESNACVLKDDGGVSSSVRAAVRARSVASRSRSAAGEGGASGDTGAKTSSVPSVQAVVNDFVRENIDEIDFEEVLEFFEEQQKSDFENFCPIELFEVPDYTTINDLGIGNEIVSLGWNASHKGFYTTTLLMSDLGEEVIDSGLYLAGDRVLEIDLTNFFSRDYSGMTPLWNEKLGGTDPDFDLNFDGLVDVLDFGLFYKDWVGDTGDMILRVEFEALGCKKTKTWLLHPDLFTHSVVISEESREIVTPLELRFSGADTYFVAVNAREDFIELEEDTFVVQPGDTLYYYGVLNGKSSVTYKQSYPRKASALDFIERLLRNEQRRLRIFDAQ